MQILVKFFDPNSESFAEWAYDAFCSHIFDYACLRPKAYLLSKRFKIMKNLYRPYIKNIFENGWCEHAYPSSYFLDPPLAISYGNHQKSRFHHLAPLILFFFTKRQSQNGGAWFNIPPPLLNTLLVKVSRNH